MNELPVCKLDLYLNRTWNSIGIDFIKLFVNILLKTAKYVTTIFLNFKLFKLPANHLLWLKQIKV